MVNQSGLHEKIREASQLEPDMEILEVLFSRPPSPPSLLPAVPAPVSRVAVIDLIAWCGSISEAFCFSDYNL